MDGHNLVMLEVTGAVEEVPLARKLKVAHKKATCKKFYFTGKTKFSRIMKAAFNPSFPNFIFGCVWVGGGC